MPPDLNPARTAARELVASTLLYPLLRQAREDPFQSDLFHGGQGEEVFAQQLDTILADRITQATRLPIVDAIERRLTGATAGAPGIKQPSGVSPSVPALTLPPAAAQAGKVDIYG